MEELTLHTWLVYGLLLASPGVLVGLLFVVRAEYGRHQTGDSVLPSLPPKLAWVLMESPAVLLFLYVYFLGGHRLDTIPLVLMGMFQFHYLNRTFIYPLRIRPGAKRVGLSTVALAFLFQAINGYLIARWISHFGYYADWSLWDPRLLAGLVVFATGWWINTDSDRILRNLRKPGETAYKIPHGGLYPWVSSPNYLGEMLEWFGFAIASWSLAGLAFAVFTVANLGPRAWQNHQWYIEKFEDYPAERRALFPFIL